MGKKVCLWNVHETAENVLRSRAYSDFSEDCRIERDAFGKDVNQRLKDLNDLVELKAVKTVVDNSIKDLNDLVELKAVKTEVDSHIKELNDLVGAAAKKIDVDNSFESMQADVDARATQAGVDDLETRMMALIAALEAKMMRLLKQPDAPPSGGGTNEPPVTPVTPVINTGGTNGTPAPNDADAKNSSPLLPNPPKWITYSRREFLKGVALDLNIPEEDLKQYNLVYNLKMNSDTTGFWSGKQGEKALVLVPETTVDQRPQRRFQTNAHPFEPHSSGRVIANYFGYPVIPGEMKVTVTGAGKWVNVDPDTDYNDHTMTIPCQLIK
jgi:hypothetical protein